MIKQKLPVEWHVTSDATDWLQLYPVFNFKFSWCIMIIAMLTVATRCRCGTIGGERLYKELSAGSESMCSDPLRRERPEAWWAS